MVKKLYEIYDIYENMLFKLELDTLLVHLAREGNLRAQKKIAIMCRNTLPQKRRSKIFIHFQNLEFTNLESGKRLEQKSSLTAKNSFAHRTDNLSACDYPGCTACENGQYEKCYHRP